jgi:hypothetical protein
MVEVNNKRENTAGCKRPPFVGLIAFLMGILIGIFIPLSRALRKTSKIAK